jgi:hypothetical protein
MKFLVTLLIPGLAAAAIFPETLGPYRRVSTGAAVLTDQALWNEYGLKSAETATYGGGEEKFTADVYRLQDPTAALGAFDWQKPPDAKPSRTAELAVETPKALLLVHGNYLFSFQGYKPSSTELAPILGSLRDFDTSPLPALPGFFPSAGLIPNSERYVIGPAGLAKFAPAIPPSVAAFHLGAEAQWGLFHSPKGDMALAVFNYPTPQIARQKEDEFRKLPKTVVKRSGPLVAVLVAPPDPDAAERLLAQVRYEAEITLHERTPTSIHQVGSMIVNIFILTGILAVFCVIAGLFVGGFRVFLLRGRKGQPEDSMILLHLEQR